MSNRMRLIAGLAGGLLLWSGAALCQDYPADCSKAATPASVEGQIVKVDLGQEKLTVRGADETVHEFQASKETLQDYKVGDAIKAKLRSAPECNK